MNKDEKKYWTVKIKLFLLVIIFGYSINNMISSKNLNLNKVVYILIGLSAIVLVSKISTWLQSKENTDDTFIATSDNFVVGNTKGGAVANTGVNYMEQYESTSEDITTNIE